MLFCIANYSVLARVDTLDLTQTHVVGDFRLLIVNWLLIKRLLHVLWSIFCRDLPWNRLLGLLERVGLLLLGLQGFQVSCYVQRLRNALFLLSQRDLEVEVVQQLLRIIQNTLRVVRI